jgi:hypothetical protein
LPAVAQAKTNNQVQVTFMHEPGVRVELAPLGTHSSSIGQNNTGALESTSFSWTHTPQIREVAFLISDHGRPVRATLATDTIWWASLFSITQDAEQNWQSSPLLLSANTFAPRSDAELWLRFPRGHKSKSSIGFDSTNRRDLGRVDADGIARARLHEFSEAPELTTLGTHSLYLWVTHHGEEERLEIAMSRSRRRVACAPHRSQARKNFLIMFSPRITKNYLRGLISQRHK